MNYKIDRIQKLIRNEISKIISEKTLSDPRIPNFLTITKIKISKDLHYCHIYFSMFEDDNKKKIAVSGLNNASGYIQKILADRLNLKYTPKLEFRYDVEDDKAYKVDQILNSISKKNEENNNS